ncbi:MAG: ABC transporter ATP-binding protein/permease [Clostridiales bacterium]|nr:ABC transporter ATP-binding protein/permease [Clostridiales bacterium]
MSNRYADRPSHAPGRDSGRAKNKKATLLRLLRYMLHFKWLLLLALLLTLASNTLALIGPRLSGAAINCIAREEGVDFAGVGHYVLLMLVFYLGSSLLSYLLSILMVHISRRVTLRMRRDLFNRLMDMPVSFTDTHPVGDIISRIFYDTDTINTSLSADVVHILASAITIVGSLSMMLDISAPLVLVFAVTIPLSMILTTLITRRTQPLFRLRSRKMGELNDFSEEMISGLKTLKAYHREEKSMESLDALNEEVVSSYYKSEYNSSMMGPSVGFINNLSLSMVSVFGALLFMSGRMDLGSISSFVQYSRKFSGPINEIANIYGELQSALAAAERVFSLLDEPLEKADAPDAAPLEDVRGEVEMRRVFFGYEPGKTILRDLSFTARSGALVAIVGPTGAGKTTLINLLMRFYDIDRGRLLVDGRDAYGVTRESLRRAYSMVLQDTWLFSGTIYDNIAYAKPGATREEVEAAAKAARIHHYVMSLPDGYDTVITDDGANISKGQKQLLTIARAMLVDARMLILDEATSNVDTRTEAQIQQAMRRLMRDKTCFVVAHRLSTIRHADLILVVRDGNVIERGTHDELMRRGGFYRELYDAQFA